jgi:hypothetical protein
MHVRMLEAAHTAAIMSTNKRFKDEEGRRLHAGRVVRFLRSPTLLPRH